MLATKAIRYATSGPFSSTLHLFVSLGAFAITQGEEMNTEIIAHPILQHVGITTPNLDAMLDWYRKVLGMAVNKRVSVPTGRAPFRAVAFLSNDEINHRLSLFEVPEATIDSERSRHARVQHIAFAYGTLDDLLGTYVRLNELGMTPMWAADQSFQTAIYYEDPDKNIIELNVDNFTNLWAVTEQLKGLPPQLHVFIDPEKLIAARKAGASPWEIHLRAFAGEFVPAEPYDLGRSY
jgi:catechol 2,3-dioxygenase